MKGQAVSLSDQEIDDLADFVAVYRAKGMAWIKVREKEWQSPIVKFFTAEEKKALAERIEMAPGDLVFFVADQSKVVNESLGNLRNHLGRRLNLIDDNQFKFLWVTRFPMFEFDQTENRYQALHHPFTAPLEADYHLLETDPVAAKSRAYDLVLNGTVFRKASSHPVATPLGLAEQERETIGVATDRTAPDFVFEFIVGAIVQVGKRRFARVSVA